VWWYARERNYRPHDLLVLTTINFERQYKHTTPTHERNDSFTCHCVPELEEYTSFSKGNLRGKPFWLLQ